MSKLFENILNTFSEKINHVRKYSMGVPKSLKIDLSITHTDWVYGIAGNLFYIWSAPDESNYIGIKVNSSAEPMINYSVHTGLITPFDKLLITTPSGQAGTIVLLYGTEAPDLLRLIDNRSTTVAGVGGLLTELRGDLTPETWPNQTAVPAVALEILPANVARKACIIQAKSINPGIVYLGFDNTVHNTKWIAELQAGMSFSVDDYRGALWAISTTGNDYVGYGEW